MSGSSEILAAIRSLQTHFEGQLHATNKTIQELRKSVDLWFEALQAGPLPARSGSHRSFQRPPSPAEQHPLRRSAPTEAPPFPSSAAASTSSPSTSPPLTSPLSEPAPEPTAILAAPPAASGANLTALLEKAGCKTSNSPSTFAPNDEASKDVDSPDLCKFSNAEVVSFLQYQALATYTPVRSLKQTEGRITTLATNGAGKYDLGVKTAGDSITLDTGVDSSRIASTVLESTPLSGKAPSPAPGPALEVTPPPNFHFQPLPPPPPPFFSSFQVLAHNTWPSPSDTKAQTFLKLESTPFTPPNNKFQDDAAAASRRGVIFSLYALEEVYKDVLQSPP